MPEKRTHDYVRHGTTSLCAAFNIADGTVISSLHRRHRAIEFKKFLTKRDLQVPAHLDIHVIADNYGTHKTSAITAWLASDTARRCKSRSKSQRHQGTCGCSVTTRATYSAVSLGLRRQVSRSSADPRTLGPRSMTSTRSR